MAKKKAAPKAARPVPQNSVINLKGSDDYRDWLDQVHRKSHIPKTTLFRLAMAEWAKRNGYHEPPEI